MMYTYKLLTIFQLRSSPKSRMQNKQQQDIRKRPGSPIFYSSETDIGTSEYENYISEKSSCQPNDSSSPVSSANVSKANSTTCLVLKEKSDEESKAGVRKLVFKSMSNFSSENNCFVLEKMITVTGSKTTNVELSDTSKDINKSSVFAEATKTEVVENCALMISEARSRASCECTSDNMQNDVDKSEISKTPVRVVVRSRAFPTDIDGKIKQKLVTRIAIPDLQKRFAQSQ